MEANQIVRVPLTICRGVPVECNGNGQGRPLFGQGLFCGGGGRRAHTKEHEEAGGAGMRLLGQYEPGPRQSECGFMIGTAAGSGGWQGHLMALRLRPQLGLQIIQKPNGFAAVPVLPPPRGWGVDHVDPPTSGRQGNQVGEEEEMHGVFRPDPAPNLDSSILATGFQPPELFCRPWISTILLGGLRSPPPPQGISSQRSYRVDCTGSLPSGHTKGVLSH